ncbi:DEAD/DEAH box helicase family protein [Paraburkholderia denitrificans]|uniref:DEAD/DEAH box helicase family protein n=1 Tax=Paraburkholderia denitrificans TaxID=694025 RepID=A0ABW0J742_9BURK
MNRELHSITQRLSLRAPQADSLEILAEALESLPLKNDITDGRALDAIREKWSKFEDFEREFPSLCFALATGVGKTRLMGAFIAYLYLTGKSRHFFVLAPNTTIYQKLINDFTPGHPKYVFKGIAEFATNPPLVITGDNYDSGRGVRLADGRASDLFGSDVHINIFNIDKINKEEGPRGSPKMKKLQETIGESYYDYLAGLDDLVLVMDEAHRYRASAGAKAIDGLRPILGLELTATPKTVGARSAPFRNVIYSYSLGQAMADGFVKEPAVATRKDFDPKSVSEDRLEQIKLEDAVHNHDHVAVELDRYHRVTERPKVHPFILVVAQDTDHARRLRTYIESDDFFHGRFKDKVAEVHSALRGEESEDATQRLVALEQDDRTDIVIHVNKLKEGWDVTNLYTIVPLRASASDILTEQTLGRGLRLPYGERVTRRDEEDFAAVDRLTVIAHDRFDEIIQKAREPGSIVMKHIEIGAGCDVSSGGATLVTAPSIAEIMITGGSPSLPGLEKSDAPVLTLETPEETRTAEVTLEVIRRFERKLGNAGELRSPDVQRQIAEAVQEIVRPAQSTLEGIVPATRVEEIVEAVTQTVAARTLSIPQILVLPKRRTTFQFADFDLDDLSTINVRPIDDGLIIQSLRTEVRTYLAKTVDDPREERLEDYLVRFLIERNEIDYDAHADLLYKLAGQVIARIGSYLEIRADIENVLLRNGRQLAELIFAQMMQNYVETPLDDDDYEVRVTRGFTLLQPQPFNIVPGQRVRDFRQQVSPVSDTKRQVFGGFKRCCYSLQKFDSDPERRFAVLIDADPIVEKWLKPGRAQFQIEYRAGDNYEPDFVIETRDAVTICEVKSKTELADPIVQAKAKAATKWCRAATQHAAESGGKPWSYALIGDDQIIGSATLTGLMARFTHA